ncbi:unnamed protein product [Microthlaspi erraticum]|uniref:PB1 domain-containing protein n=1 Tax=Microthlaspi erraticum TaxID=1685480 RepID=A0A6D2IFZ2_9BRAS|nr:unnamed protein product [Microthlaspi erraticum]
MVYIASVYGEWVRKDNLSWHFEVDYRKGGRMFSLRDGCTHDELIQMALDDYSVMKIGHRLELSYPLPQAFTQQMHIDSPSTFVTNDRQVQSLIELSRTHVLRLFDSSKRREDTLSLTTRYSRGVALVLI